MSEISHEAELYFILFSLYLWESPVCSYFFHSISFTNQFECVTTPSCQMSLSCSLIPFVMFKVSEFQVPKVIQES